MTEVTLKRGDTLIWECEYIDDAGSPVDLTAYSIASQARDASGNILFDVTSADSVDIYNPTSGYFRVTINGTSAWETGKYNVDIQYTIGTVVKSSDTFNLVIQEDITR